MSKANKTFNDEDLEMLLAVDVDGEPATAPPDGLLERLLSDIPEEFGLEQASEADDETVPGLPTPANDDGPRYWRWAVAATVMTALGIGTIMVRHQDSADFASVPEAQFGSASALVETELDTEPVDGQTSLESMARRRAERLVNASGAGAEHMDAEEAEQLKQLEQQLGAAAKEQLEQLRRRELKPLPVGRAADDQVAADAPGSLKKQDRDVASPLVSRAARAGKAPSPPPPAPRSDQEGALDLRARPSEKKAQQPVTGARKIQAPADPSARLEVVEELTVTAEAPVIDEAKALSMKMEIEEPAPSMASPEPERRRRQTASHLASLGYVGADQRSMVNEQPFADNYFESRDTNPFIDTEDDRLSTFGLDVDTGSYGVVREYLRRGHLPPRGAVRVEEMLNYFNYRDRPPSDGEGDFALSAEGGPSIYGEGERYYLLRVGIKGREVSRENRPPALLTFVIDVSGSMGREDRLGLVKQSLMLLLDQLRDKDRVALVVYGSRGRVVLEPSSDRDAIRRAILSLHPEGATNAGEGLELAYAMAARSRRPGEINRLILCSDGVANVGKTSVDSILSLVREHASRGVELTTVGFGMGNYNDLLMEQLADRGNGRYAYVDSLTEARRIFVENLTGTLQTIAAEARSQVEINPEIVSRYRLLGYENRDIADQRFRDDTVDAGEIGAGHTVTALYELKTKRALRPKDRVATVHLRYASIAEGEMTEQKLEVRGTDFARSWGTASSSFQLAALVGELAEVLGRSYWARDADPRDVFIRLQQVAAEFPGDTAIAELATLAGKTADLKKLERDARGSGPD